MLDGTITAREDSGSDRPAKKRLVSSAGPSVPIRKQANDSVPASWMSRLEAARVTTSPPAAADAAPSAAPSTSEPPRNPAAPPPLKTKTNPPSNGGRKDQETPVGKPAHLLIAQLEAEDRTRTSREAERVAALFAEDRSDEIAKVEIKLAEGPKQKKIPDWLVAAVLAVLVIAVAGTAIYLARKEPGPTAEIDPAVAAAAEKKRQAVLTLEEGHRFALEGKSKADDAIKMYSKALELDPTLASAERGIAIAFAQKDDDASAVEHYKKYLAISPTALDADDVRKIIDKYEKSKAPPPAVEPEKHETKAPVAKKKRRGSR